MIILGFIALMAVCTIIAVPLGIIKAIGDMKEKKLKEERYQEEKRFRQEILSHK